MWHHWLEAADKLVFETISVGSFLLLVTIVYAVIVTFFASRHSRTWASFRNYLWPKEILTHPSARADFLFWLSRRVFMPLMVMPLAFSMYVSGHFAYGLLTKVFGAPAEPPGPGSPWMLILFTASVFVVADFAYYTYHYAQHKFPILWELHKVHHSAEVMIGVTKDRIHPIDELMYRWWEGMFTGLVYGVFLFFALDPVEVLIFGVSIYAIRQTIIMMDFVRHTHMKVSYGRWLNSIFICPHYHQLHHSVDPNHYDHNFGLAFSFWDRLFGTLMVPKPNEDFEFGLVDREAEDYRGLAKLHVVPLVKIYRLIAPKLRLRAMKPSRETTPA